MNERETALFALMDIINDNGYNNIVLKRTLKNSNLSKVERAFVTEAVNGTLRNLMLIDHVINSFSTVNTKKMKPLILAVLRMSVYQIMFMKKVPVSAVCNEAVKIVKKKRLDNLSGFVNGVLRNIARNIDKVKLPDEEKEPVRYLSIRYSYPEWIIEYWLETMAYDTVKSMCEANNEAPKICICVNSTKTDKEELKKILAEENIASSDMKIIRNGLYITKTKDISENEAFGKGLFHVMDESSMLAAEVLDPRENEYIIDVCAAPGGKSFYCAYKMKNKGKISSRDIYEHKLKLIDDGAKRLGIDIIDTQFKDAQKMYEDDIKKADRVIVDAPCSGFGLVRKKPDIKYSKKPEDIEELQKIQREILEAAQNYVKDDGILLYSTCTVSRKENEDNVKWFCEKFGFELVDISGYINDVFEAEEVRSIQILPDMMGTDGFFIAKMKRKAKG